MRICIVGDTGSGTADQYAVSEIIKRYHDTNKLKAILLLGDNIYEDGVNDVNDEQFHTKFELPYNDIDVPFYLLLGNHDYANLSGTHAYNAHAVHQVKYDKLSSKWNMPQRYYSLKLGNCEFFMLDTNLDNMTKPEIDKQIHYMKKKIKTSKKKNKFLCGHHTWRSTGGHGNADPQFEKFMRRIAAGTNIKAYFCGHDHCKNHIVIPFPTMKKTLRTSTRKTMRKSKKKLHIYVIGTGGKYMDESHLDEKQIRYPDKLMYQDADLGFIILENKGNQLSIQMHSIDNYPNNSYKNII
tara:strand:+ start:1661 stop:2548 length:888 start_codon:yes stop_codon:yes gene_type:complete